MGDEVVNRKPLGKRLLFYISPCIITAISFLFMTIWSYLDLDNSMGWSAIGFMIFIPMFFVALMSDFVVKAFVKWNILHLWSIELVLIAITSWILFQFSHQY
jgi:hypothetical protein